MFGKTSSWVYAAPRDPRALNHFPPALNVRSAEAR